MNENDSDLSPFSPYQQNEYFSDFLSDEFDANSPSTLNAISNEIKLQTLNIDNTNWNQIPQNLNPALFEKEIQQRNNILFQQQKRIKQLEDLLAKATLEIEKLQHEVSTHLRDKEIRNKSIKNQSRYWTSEEHERFLQALDLFGSKDVKSIANHVSTRSPTQVRTHAQKYFLRLRERKRDGDKKIGKLDINDMNSSGDELCKNNNNISNSNGSFQLSGISKIEIKKEKYRNRKSDLSNSLPNLRQSLLQSNCASIIKKSEQNNIDKLNNDNENILKNSFLSSRMLNNNQKFTDLEKFLSGLEATKSEPDIEKKCAIIKENFLPSNTIDEIKAWIFVHLKTVEKMHNAELETVVNNIGSKRSRKSCPPGYAGIVSSPEAPIHNIVNNTPNTNNNMNNETSHKTFFNRARSSSLSNNAMKAYSGHHMHKPLPQSSLQMTTSPQHSFQRTEDIQIHQQEQIVPQLQNIQHSMLPPHQNQMQLPQQFQQHPVHQHQHQHQHQQFPNMFTHQPEFCPPNQMFGTLPYTPGAPPPSRPAPPPPVSSSVFCNLTNIFDL